MSETKQNQTESYWRLPCIYADECWFSANGTENLIVGLLIAPPACDLEANLQDVRQRVEFLDEVHATNLRGDKMLRTAKAWFDSFVASTALFRGIIIPRTEPEFTTFCDQKRWRLVNKGIHLSLTFCYPGIDSSGVIKLLRPRIFLDENEDYATNRDLMLAELKAQFERHDLFMGAQLRRFPAPILQLVNSRSLDCVQLCDVLVACIHWQLEPPQQANKSEFLDYVKRRFNISNMANVARWNTGNRINVWPFKESIHLVE